MIHLSTLTEHQVRQLIKSNFNYIDRPAFGKFLTDAYNQLIRSNLRINPKTWIVRDNNGEISRPSDLANWPVCTKADAERSLAHEVWCNAVRLENLEFRVGLR